MWVEVSFYVSKNHDTVCCKLQICVAVLKQLNSLNSDVNKATNINYHQNEQLPITSVHRI